jgi:mannan polymerase II complex MNN10 subunit
MEPSRSLNQQIFTHLNEIAERNISKTFNPLGIPDIPHVDYTKSMDILISQDCSGFNLGSFLIRRSEFTRRVLDMWWDPILYEQKHMDWDHKEQDAFVPLGSVKLTQEHLYATQAYIRSGTGFLPQRSINAFPEGACDGYEGREDIFYSQKGRDFIVNMAGCKYFLILWT